MNERSRSSITSFEQTNKPAEALIKNKEINLDGFMVATKNDEIKISDNSYESRGSSPSNSSNGKQRRELPSR